MRIRLAHSPDPDDAFMFYGLSCGAVDPGPWQFEHILEDIQTLNERAGRGEYEVSAISMHAYPHVAARYALCSCGSSMGDGYGPMIVVRAGETSGPPTFRTMADEASIVRGLRGRRIAIPGKMTTAYLALQLLIGRDGCDPTVVMFDEIPGRVAAGDFDAGLIIHEGQLTFERDGLRLVVDLGAWWMARTGLPLPLGGNVVRRDLGDAACRDIQRIMRESIRYSLAHREEAVKYALRFGRGLDNDLADRFVGMYVNDWTVDYGERGRTAIRRLLSEGAAAGLVPAIGHLEFIPDE